MVKKGRRGREERRREGKEERWEDPFPHYLLKGEGRAGEGEGEEEEREWEKGWECYKYSHSTPTFQGLESCAYPLTPFWF